MEELLHIDNTWGLCYDMVRYLGDGARTRKIDALLLTYGTHSTFSLSIASSRLPLGDAGIIETTVAMMNKDPHPLDFDVQALRVLGNLCIDRGK